MTDAKDPVRRLENLMDALADATEAASDEEVLADAVARGVDVEAQATRVRGLLMDAVVKAKQARMVAARAAHVDAVAKLVTHVALLPAQPAARREMLFRVLKRKQVQEASITLQHREFESYSDSDVESVLRDLDALGLLEDDEPES